MKAKVCITPRKQTGVSHVLSGAHGIIPQDKTTNIYRSVPQQTKYKMPRATWRREVLQRVFTRIVERIQR